MIKAQWGKWKSKDGRRQTGGRVCLKRKLPRQDKRMAKADGEWRMGRGSSVSAR